MLAYQQVVEAMGEDEPEASAELIIADRVTTRAVRHSLVAAGDIRGEVGFQNDVNLLLAALGSSDRALVPVAPLFTTPADPTKPRARSRRRHPPELTRTLEFGGTAPRRR